MITGLSNVNNEINEKLLELLLAAAPKMRRVGFLADSSSAVKNTYAANLKGARRATEHYRVEASFADAARPEDIEGALSRLAKDGAQGLIIMSSAWFSAERSRIIKLALAQRWPVVASQGEYTNAGALISYGVDRTVLYRRAASYVDRILKGAKPGDLPIEQPTKFELVVNMKTAKALGLTIPQPFLMRADRVIE
jgi:putative ABC transport system substrate-binding protein